MGQTTVILPLPRMVLTPVAARLNSRPPSMLSSTQSRAIICSNPGRQPILPHRRFADRSNLTQVHSGDDLTADQITTVSVGDRERIAAGAITRSEVPPEIHASELIGGCHLREGLRVWRRASLLALWTRESGSLKDVSEGTGHRPNHARI